MTWNFNLYASRISDEDATMIRRYGERLDTLLGVEFTGIIHMSYDEVKEKIPELITSGSLNEAILMVMRSKRKYLTATRLFFVSNVKKLKFILWLQDQYKMIAKLEQMHLTSPPDPKMVAAGIRELDLLEDKNLIDALADGDILKWEEIRKLPYEKIFDKQLKTTIERRIDKRARDNDKRNNLNK